MTALAKEGSVVAAGKKRGEREREREREIRRSSTVVATSVAATPNHGVTVFVTTTIIFELFSPPFMEGATMLLAVAVKERMKGKKLLPPSMSVVAAVRLQNSGTRIEEEERVASPLPNRGCCCRLRCRALAAGNGTVSPKSVSAAIIVC
ncbi:hypothetical protein PIB30_061356 [Stylosanthes scabra]|uniref:Uncharacterized protein n=1 Tax=Stylosanthes scabra TaxID=79078 RepID=A0ABU6SLB3_9FABA|nr:hypothetical protein [Stylosanthes scabra]